ncbi:XrtA/PEP-CTERM system TPR-repeat protein PrsT [Thiosocius teredinicola]|uniref:XrtA/PEP-CTERM system TPR-repeat protein PrsT n=1 Tax=Thiosocius teredinicola TaxID=1973002 RepID=UPI0009914DF4
MNSNNDSKTGSSRRRWRALLLATAMTAIGAAQAADPLATRYYEDAVARFNNDDPKGALIQLKNALQRDPGQLSAKILLGRVHLTLDDPVAAEEELVQAQKLGADPLLVAGPLAKARNALGKYELNLESIIPTRFPRSQQPDLWEQLGIARLETDDPAGATIAFQEALQIDPTHVGAKLGLAKIPLKQKKFAETSRLVDDILSVAPDNAEAWFVKGSATHALGQFDEASKAYNRAHSLDPNHQQAALGEATAILESGDAARAVALLEPLERKFPAVATIPYLRSEALKALNRTADADAARAKASSLISAYSSADVSNRGADLLLYGTIAFEGGQLETAYQFLSAYVDGHSGDAQGRKLLGRILLAMGKPNDAQRVLLRLSANNQADAEALALLGDAHMQSGDEVAAERYYRDALENYNGGPALVRRLGMTQFYSGQRDQALQTLESLVEQTSGAAKADSSLLLGMLYYSENRFNEAGGVADRLVKESPDNLTARNLQALVAVARGDSAQGRSILESILAKDPTFRPARYNLIKLDVAEGRTQQAGAAFAELLATDPNDTRALLEAARFALKQNNARLAIQHLEKLHELEPNNVLGNIELINTYLAVGDTASAATKAAALNRAVPNDYLVTETLARVQLAEDDKTGATITLGDVARFAGEDVERLMHTARLFIVADDADAAAWVLSKVLAVDPDAHFARNELATVYFRQRKLADAEAEAQAVLQRDAKNAHAMALLGDIRLAQQKPAEAVGYYKKAREIQDSPQLVISQHRGLIRSGKESDALKVLSDWNAQHPGVAAVVRVLARHQMLRGDQKAALALHEELVDLTPDDPIAWSSLADALSTYDTERALKAATKAYELAPDNPAVLDTLGWTLTQLGELERGLAHLRDALARNGRSPTIRYHLAVALQEYGNASAARREYENALRMSDDFPERAEAEARLNALQATK